MATHIIPIMNWTTQPDGSGDAYFDIYSNIETTPQYDMEVLVLVAATTTKITISGSFRVPKNYVGSATFRCLWTCNATSGDWEFDLEYRSIAIGEAGDPTTDQETLNVNDTAPGTAFLIQEAVLTPTASNFAVDDIVFFKFGRDDTDAGDTLAADVIVFGLYFQYDDA